MISTKTKIFKVGDKLIGCAGNSDVAAAVIEWFRAGCDPATYPEMQKNKEFWCEVLVISPGPKVARYEQTPHPLEFEDKFLAIGSGRPYAMAAMHLGKSAKEAVLIASHLCCDCGNGVDFLTLENYTLNVVGGGAITTPTR